MSRLADEQARRAFPRHQQVNGDSVSRITSDQVRTDDIVGVWNEYSEDQLSSQRPDRNLDEGLRITRHGLLLLAIDQAVDKGDSWIVIDEMWQVQRVGVVCEGYRELYLQRDDKDHTSKPARRRVV
jgi:hypothetical protein